MTVARSLADKFEMLPPGKVHQHMHLTAPILAAAALLAVCGGSVLQLRGQQRQPPPASKNTSRNSPGPKETIPAAPALAGPAPFAVGEVLNYRLIWAVFSNAAAVQLVVVETRDFFGTPVWHLRASAHSQVPLRSLAVVDDQFDSYADIATLESKQYEMYLDEMGEKQKTLARFVITNPANQGLGSAVLVKRGTRDPLAALYLLRTVDWQRTPEIRAPVYDGEDLYEMRAHVEGAGETIPVAGSDLKTTKIVVELFRGGHLSRTRCSIWFSQNAARLPVLIQAEVPYGSVRGELVSHTP